MRRRARRLQLRVCGKQACRFYIGDKYRPFMFFGKVAADQHAHFIGENFLAFIIYYAAAIAIAVKGKTNIGCGFEHLIAQRVQHFHVFGVRIVIWETVVQIAIEFDNFDTELLQHLRRKRARRAIAASDNGF